VNRPRRGSRYLLALAAVAGVVALTACASSGQSGTPTPSSSGTSTPPPVTRIAGPSSRIPLKCSQFSNIVELDHLLGNGILVSKFQLPYQLNSYIDRQAGSLRCAWANSYTDYAENSTAYLIVTVTPDVTDAMWAAYAPRLAADGTDENVYGPGSRSSCSGTSTGSGCRLDVRYGTTWLSVSIVSSIVGTNATAHVALGPLLQNAATLVKGITVAEPRWQDPAAAPVSTATPFPLSDAGLAAALGQPVKDEGFGPTTSDGPHWGSGILVGDKSGAWSTASGSYGISLEVLPAGAWAWNRVISAARGQSVFASAPGIGQAAISFTNTQSNPASSIVEGIAGHNLFVVDITPSGASSPPASGLALKVAKELAAVLEG
jgi:hypothetical protein